MLGSGIYPVTGLPIPMLYTSSKPLLWSLSLRARPVTDSPRKRLWLSARKPLQTPTSNHRDLLQFPRI